MTQVIMVGTNSNSSSQTETSATSQLSQKKIKMLKLGDVVVIDKGCPTRKIQRGKSAEVLGVVDATGEVGVKGAMKVILMYDDRRLYFYVKHPDKLKQEYIVLRDLDNNQIRIDRKLTSSINSSFQKDEIKKDQSEKDDSNSSTDPSPDSQDRMINPDDLHPAKKVCKSAKCKHSCGKC